MTNTAGGAPPPGGGAPDQRNLQSIGITDFSPGIYNNSAVAFGTPTGTGGVPANTTAGLFPAPPGAADVAGTFGCIALANGGLGPLPGQGGVPATHGGMSFNDMGIGISGAADVTAMINTFQTATDELIFVVTDSFTPTTQRTSIFSYQVGINSVTAIPGGSNTYTFARDNKNYCTYPFSTLINMQPVVVLPVSTPANTATSNLWVYPNVSTPSTFSLTTIDSGATVDGTAFAHQGRIGILRRLTGYGWPIPTSTRPNESFNYTDPSQSVTWPVQDERFGPENPFGFGAVNSVSAGELFCVKARGGAIIIQGDLNNPTVTTLPGVESTGPFYGRAGTDQNGMYYCSANRGAWLWGGGNASQKISAQLDDNFYEVNNPITDTLYYGYNCERWSSMMLFSNNWVFSSSKGSWWRLEDPNVQSYFWYVPGWESQWMFAASPTVTGPTDKFLYEYDLNLPRRSFTWQSLPLKPPTADRFVSVRELVIRASNPYGDAAPQIAATLIDDSANTYPLDTWAMTPGIDTVQEIRLNARVSQTSTIAVKLACSGTTYAPVVYGLSLAFRAREHVALA